MIHEHDLVVLAEDVPEHGLKSGDVGTAVHIYSNAEAMEVEFLTLDGETLVVVTLPLAKVRPIGKREIMHARPLTAA